MFENIDSKSNSTAGGGEICQYALLISTDVETKFIDNCFYKLFIHPYNMGSISVKVYSTYPIGMRAFEPIISLRIIFIYHIGF